MRRGKSTEIALCGMMTALAVVILCLGGLIPAATFCCPVLASLVLLPVMQRWGRRDAVLVWAASAILGLCSGRTKRPQRSMPRWAITPRFGPVLTGSGLRSAGR